MIDPITRTLAVVDSSLREYFPDDYHSRCMYASLGIVALLSDLGVEAQVIGGDFMCGVVPVDLKKPPFFQGFGLSPDSDLSHFWVETREEIIDLGPSYLSEGASRPIFPIPFLRWNRRRALPNFIKYREVTRLASDVVIADSVLQERSEEFRAQCRAKADPLERGVGAPTWELRDMVSLNAAARSGDWWAKGMLYILSKGINVGIPTR